MLTVDAVDLHYGAAIALRKVSITAETGAVTCLMGRNGVGKTSLLRAITGAHPVSAGKVMWEGRDITRMPTFERARRGIAWVPQGRDVFPLLTVRENLETGFAVLPRRERRVPDEMDSRQGRLASFQSCTPPVRPAWLETRWMSVGRSKSITLASPPPM